MANWFPKIPLITEPIQKFLSSLKASKEEPKPVNELMEAKPDPHTLSEDPMGMAPLSAFPKDPSGKPVGPFGTPIEAYAEAKLHYKEIQNSRIIEQPRIEESTEDKKAESGPEWLSEYAKKDREAGRASREENEKEQSDFPEWPRSILSPSQISSGPSTEVPQGQLVETPQPQQSIQQASVPVQPQGMMANEQVVGGYSRTEKLLELMMLRGIPSLKPPRGP